VAPDTLAAKPAAAGDKVLVTTLTMRDGLQSTGVWKDFLPTVKQAIAELKLIKAGARPAETPALDRMRKIARLVNETGYTGAEVFWGQSFQKHMIAEISPFESIELFRHVCGDDFQLSGLGRGVNAVGFRPYGPDVVSTLVTRFAERGGAPGRKNIRIRIFDALNNPQNCASMIGASARYNANSSADAKLIHIEAALCYQPERDIHNFDADGNIVESKKLFTDEYYVNYAKKHIATAEAEGSVLDSLVIKDMAGQLNAERLDGLLPQLQALGLPVYLHMHATNYEGSVETVRKAAELGAAGVEVTDWPLADGTAHPSVRDVIPGLEDRLVPIDLTRLDELEAEFSSMMGNKDELFADEGTPKAHRDDLKLSREERLILWRLGIPGGAMPAVMDLLIKTCKIAKIEMAQAIDRFQEELERLQGEIGWVPLVTPMADIVYTQVIINMQNGRYNVIEDRFAKTILGHYGRYIDHADDQEVQFAPNVVKAVIDYCAGVKDGTKLALGGKPYPAPEMLTKQKVYDPEMDAARGKLTPLLERAGIDPSDPVADEAIVMKLMEPPASTNLTERILLASHQERLLGLIEALSDATGDTERLFAEEDELALFASFAAEKRAERIVDDLLAGKADANMDALLDREAVYAGRGLPTPPTAGPAAAKAGGNGDSEAEADLTAEGEADPQTLRRAVARLLTAALQNRYMENHVMMAKGPDDIPFEPTLAFYYSGRPEDPGSFPDAEVQKQLTARLQKSFQQWVQNAREPDAAGSDYHNRLLHAALAGDWRLQGVVPPVPLVSYLDS
jgi:oxaloacetate decarboxylase alpha subunit